MSVLSTKIKNQLVLFILISVVINFNLYSQDQNQNNINAPEVAQTKEMDDFILKNLKYPQLAVDNKISAKVYLKVTGDENGKVIDAEIFRTDITDNAGEKILLADYRPKINPEIDSKAIAAIEAESKRVCMTIPKFYHGEDLNGKRIKALVMISVPFVLKNKRVSNKH